MQGQFYNFSLSVLYFRVYERVFDDREDAACMLACRIQYTAALSYTFVTPPEPCRHLCMHRACSWKYLYFVFLVSVLRFSDGLRTRLVFAEIALMRPHILLLDEPTNHASMEMIDSMAHAIKQFQGGVIVISHDFRLLQQVRAALLHVYHMLFALESSIVRIFAYFLVFTIG